MIDITAYLNNTASNILRYGPPKCARTLSTILQNITQLVNSASEQDRTWLRDLFNMCESNDFAHSMDGVTFLERLFFFITIYVDTRQ